MTAKEIIATIQSEDGVYSKAELMLFVENMTQEQFDAFCGEIREVKPGDNQVEHANI